MREVGWEIRREREQKRLHREMEGTLGEMKELGSESVNMHKELLSLAAETADNVICLGNEWLNTNVTAKNIKFFEDQDKLYSFLVTSINADSLILIKGSRSTRMDLIADKLKL